jgi:dihydroorotase
MNRYLLKNITILDPSSEYNGKTTDVLIEHGKIKITSDSKDAEAIDFSGCHLAPGFCDLYVHIGDPGFEYREDIGSVAEAALSGGFTTICSMADNHPITQTKAQVEYILNKAKHTAITILPVGAVTENFDGKTPTEMLDMHHAGAVAFFRYSTQH